MRNAMVFNMTKEKIKRISRTVETLKSILLALLVISMIALVVVYIRETNVYIRISSKGGEMKTFDKLWSVEEGAAAQGLDSVRLLPEFIGYRQAGGEMTCAVANQDSSAELYELLKPCILELFGSDSVCRSLTAAEGAKHIEAAITRDEFIFLRYHIPVPYQLIFAYAANQLTVAESDVAPGIDGNVIAYISEMVITPDYDSPGHRFIAYASDADGHYFEFRPEDHVVASAFYTSKLAESGANIETCRFHFSEDPRMSSTQPIVDAEMEFTPIVHTAADIMAEDILHPLLILFGYNPDKLNSYTDDTDARIFVDSSSRLRVDHRRISFVTADAVTGEKRGIRIDSLLGYSSDATLNLFDKLTAVDNLIRRLGEISPALVGGEAALCLGSVYSSGTQLVIEYFLTYNNIRIDGETMLRAVLTQDTISTVELLPITVSGSEEIAYCLHPEYSLRKLTELGRVPEDKAINAMRLQYNGTEAAWSIIR